MYQRPLLSTVLLVLIDTWWNVNAFTLTADNLIFKRFNRYMVECEYDQTCRAVIFQQVLIDTWWNVNFLALQSK